MKKNQIIKKNEDFSRIIQTGKKIKNQYFSFFYNKKNNDNKYGITIPTKTCKAVYRNKIKRQIKSIIDKNDIPKSYEYVIIIKKEILKLDFKNIEIELLKIFKRIGEKNEK